MLLKDCPVGSVARLVSFLGEEVKVPRLLGVFEVLCNGERNFVIDGEGNKRMHFYNDPDYQFEIVRPAPEPAPEPRITFTVGGQEFYVGQRVWSLEDAQDEHTKVFTQEELEVCGTGYKNTRIFTRKVGSPYMVSFLPQYLSNTPPSPHEWKRGDWARHAKKGVVFVAGKSTFGNDTLFVSDENGWGDHVHPNELTFISHSEPPK